MKSFAFATFALAVAGTASAQVNSVKIHERVFNDDSDSILVTTSNYPSEVTFNDSKLDDGDGLGGSFANRHDFLFSTDSGATDYIHSIDTFFDVKMTVSLSGLDGSVKEAGIRLNSSVTGDGILLVKTNGEIAAFGGGLPFKSFQASGSTLPSSILLGIKYFSDGGVRKVTYTAGDQSFTGAVSNTEQGVVDFTVGGYGQFNLISGNANNYGIASFTNISYQAVPEPATMLALSAGAMALIRRRRAR